MCIEHLLWAKTYQKCWVYLVVVMGTAPVMGVHSVVNHVHLLFISLWPLDQFWKFGFCLIPKTHLCLVLYLGKRISAPVHCSVSLFCLPTYSWPPASSLYCLCILTILTGILTDVLLQTTSSSYPAWSHMNISSQIPNHYAWTTSLLPHVEPILCWLPTWTTINFCWWFRWFCRVLFGVRQSWVQILVPTIFSHMTLESRISSLNLSFLIWKKSGNNNVIPDHKELNVLVYFKLLVQNLAHGRYSISEMRCFHLGHLCLPDYNLLLAPTSTAVSTTSILIFGQGWGPSSESPCTLSKSGICATSFKTWYAAQTTVKAKMERHEGKQCESKTLSIPTHQCTQACF